MKVKHFLPASFILAALLAFSGCAEDKTTEDTVHERGSETRKNVSWVEENEIVFTEPKALNMSWCSWEIIGEDKRDDFETIENVAEYSAPEITVIEADNRKTYTIKYSIDAKNKFLIPWDIQKIDSRGGLFWEYQILDSQTGQIIKYDTEQNGDTTTNKIVYEGEKWYFIKESCTRERERVVNQLLAYDEDYQVHEIDDIYHYVITITIPSGRPTPILFINTKGPAKDSLIHKDMHMFGTYEQEKIEDCIFITLDQ